MKACSETKDFVKEEKDNVEALKIELHKRQVKAEQVARTTKELMESLANCVSRRDTLVNRAVATSAHRASQRPQTTRVLVNRKIDDLRNKLKKLAREEKELTVLISEQEIKETHVRNQLGGKQIMLQNLHSKSKELNAQIEKYLYRKEAKMVEILGLQTRAKWYRAIKAKKYKMSVENDDAALNEIVQLREQNGDIKKLLERLLQDYPFYKRNLQKAIVTVSSE